MKLRTQDRSEGIILPKRTRERFSKSEVELMLTLYSKGYRAKQIASMISEKFGVKRAVASVYMKLRMMVKNGMPTFKETEVETTYDVPSTAKQMLKQIELAFTLLDNARKFLEKVQVWEVDFLDQAERLKQIEGAFSVKPN